MSSLFGLDQSNRLVFVSRVPRGLACQCRCVVCDEPLVARQGAVREHHFAHASGLEPCFASHESLLHRYAKQLILEAGGLVVPVSPGVADALGLQPSDVGQTRLDMHHVEAEISLGDVRPDLLGTTADGVQIAIEVAYTSFCDLLKREACARLALPTLEIDLSSFTPEAFDPEAVRQVVIERIDGKVWVWPAPERNAPSIETPPTPAEPPTTTPAEKARAPEEIILVSGRMVSIKQLRSGDIAVRAISYDPDVVSMLKSITKRYGATYSPKWKSWNVPRWRAEQVRRELKLAAEQVIIVTIDRREGNGG